MTSESKKVLKSILLPKGMLFNLFSVFSFYKMKKVEGGVITERNLRKTVFPLCLYEMLPECGSIDKFGHIKIFHPQS